MYFEMNNGVFNQRTDTSKRIKHIQECCQLSQTRESQAIDLLLSRFENQFLFQLVHLIAKEFNLYTFSSCVEVFESQFLQNPSDYMRVQLNKELVYDKSCSVVIPESLYVITRLLSSYSPIFGVHYSSLSPFFLYMRMKWTERESNGPYYRG